MGAVSSVCEHLKFNELVSTLESVLYFCSICSISIFPAARCKIYWCYNGIDILNSNAIIRTQLNFLKSYTEITLAVNKTWLIVYIN